MVTHWGSSSAFIALMPEENLGVAILTNLNSHGLPGALAVRVFDAYVRAPERDWSADRLARRKAAGDARRAREQEMTRTRVAGTKPSLPLRSYAGTYAHPALGEVTVAQETSGLVLRFPPATAADLEHWHHDVFRVNWRLGDWPSAWVEPGESLLAFTLGPGAAVQGLRIDGGVGEFRRARGAASGAP